VKVQHLHCLYGVILFLSPLVMAVASAQQDAIQIAASESDGSYTISASGISGSVVRATTAVKVDGKWLHAADYPIHTATISTSNGELGLAKMIILRYSGRKDAPDLLLRLRAYAEVQFGDLQVIAINTTGAPVEVQSLRLLETKGDSTRSVVNLGSSEITDRVLSDSFSEDRPAMQLRELGNTENRMHRAVGVQMLYNKQSRQSWFIGALTSDKFLSVLRLHMNATGPAATIASYEIDSTGTTELLSENSLQDSPTKDRIELSVRLAPGTELSSERMLFSVSDDYHKQLETYAHLVRDLHHARITAPTPIGWWSWTAYYFGLNEGTALTNSEWLAQHLKPLGYQFFHMDEGYQFARGEYTTPDAALFPQGVGALERRVIGQGLTPGIWTAPFEVSERSWIYIQHPEWLVHNAQGEPIHIGSVTDGLDHLYALDPTHPDAQAYLRNSYTTLVRSWGIRYIKMDFMEDSAIEGFYHTPQITALEAQRIGIQTIRDAVGPDVLLDKDGCELLNPVGLVDMGRISQDTGHTFSSSRDAATGIAARYYMNRNFYLADPDAFSVSSQTVDDQNWHGGEKPLTLDEAKVSIALSAVSGGLFEIGDDLPTLGEDPSRIALAENRDLLDMARLGRASTPLDLMSYEPADLQPSIFFLKQSSRQSILTVFNWSETTRHHSLTRASLGLAPTRSYTIFEVFADNKDSTSLGTKLDVQQAPHTVRIFKIIDISIAAESPSATVNIGPSRTAGESVLFQATSSDANNPALSFSWDFGDGIVLEGAKVTHTYTHSGLYTVHLKSMGLVSEPNLQEFPITISGSVGTKLLPEHKRRFVDAQP
jgi:alpha-galactosidase